MYFELVIGDKIKFSHNVLVEGTAGFILKDSVGEIVDFNKEESTFRVKMSKSKKEINFSVSSLKKVAHFYKDPTDRFYERYDIE